MKTVLPSSSYKIRKERVQKYTRSPKKKFLAKQKKLK